MNYSLRTSVVSLNQYRKTLEIEGSDMFGLFKKKEPTIPQEIMDKCNAFLPELNKIVEQTKRPGFFETIGPYGKEQVLTIIDNECSVNKREASKLGA